VRGCCFAVALLVQASHPARAEADGGPAVPVTVAQAKRQDVAEFTRGIGNVQAYQSVLVRARVDGTLDSVAFREGQTVKPGDLLAEIDPRPYQATLDQARAKRAADEAQMKNARLDLARYASLVRTNEASRQQVDTQTALLGQDAATIQGDDASIASAALNLSFCRITSPIEGVVGLRQVDAGNLIHATDTQGIVTITQVHPISLVFTLPQDELPRVRDAMRQGPARVIATTSEGNTVLSEGTLLTTNNTIDTQTGTIQLKATFANTDDHLWPGQFVGARLQLGILKAALTVPPDAIQHGPDGVFVYLVKPDGTVARQDVKLGYQDEQASVVTEGLQEGDRVVTGGQSRLQSGSRITVRPAS
jgi:multidrug efflux system membrane fusion protein